MPLVKHLMKELCLNLDLQNKIVKKKLLIIEKNNSNKENLEMKKNNHN